MRNGRQNIPDTRQIRLLLPDVDQQDDPSRYVFGGNVSTGELDTYYTRMGPSSLRAFADGLASPSGVPLLDSHGGFRLPLGRSFAGEMVDGVPQGRFYIPYGINVRDGTYATTDDYVRAVKQRIVDGLSVRFDPRPPTRFVCSVDGRDMFGPGCPHFPGQVVDGEIVTATIEGARLLEVSLVALGSTPGAVITSRSGNRSIDMILQQLLGALGIEEEAADEVILARVARMVRLEGEQAALESGRVEAEARAAALGEDVATLRAEVATLRADAEKSRGLINAGMTYRNRLIAATMAAGANSRTFKPEVWAPILDTLDIASLEAVSAQFGGVVEGPAVKPVRGNAGGELLGDRLLYKTG